MGTQIKMLVGLLFTVATVVVLIVIGLNEESRMSRTQLVFAGRQIEKGAEIFQTYCSTCHGIQGQGVAGKGPALNRKDLLADKSPYLKDISWAGTRHDFVVDVVAAGRPQRSKYYSLAGFLSNMPTWSQDYGGPLRPDQVDSVVAFIENWAPGQYEQSEQVVGPDVQVAVGGPTPTPRATPAGCDSKAITGYSCAKPPFPVSDSVLANGKATYDANCASCHGTKGGGDGPAAQSLNPKPRNFSDCATMGQLAMDQHFGRVNEGVPGSAMVAWKARLNETKIWEVVYYERSFCGLFEPTTQK